VAEFGRSRSALSRPGIFWRINGANEQILGRPCQFLRAAL